MRFHFGVSFRLRNLKKFIFPILLGILTYFLSNGLLAHAQESIIIDTQSVQDLDICGKPLTDYINYFEQYTSNKYRFVLSSSADFDKFTFWFIPNYFDDINYSIISYNGTNTSYGRWVSFTNVNQNESNYVNRYKFYLQFSDILQCENVSFLDNVNAQSEFLDLMENYYNFSNNPYTQDFPSINSTELRLISYPNGKIWLYNNNRMVSDVGDQYDGYMWNILYSNTPIYYDTTISTWYEYWGQNWEIFPVIYNGRTLSNGQQIDFNYFPPRTFDDYSKVSNLFVYDNVSNLSSLSLDFTYSPLDPLYSTAVYPYIYILYGQKDINDSSPYTYFDRIDASSCTLSYNTTHNNSNILHITGLNCPSSLLSGYTKVSFRIVFVYDNFNEREVDQRLISYSVNSNAISVFVNDSDYNFTYSDIYYPLNDNNEISSSTKLLLTTSDSFTRYSYVISSARYTNFIYYRLDSQELINPVYNELMWDKPYVTVDYGKSINKGVIIATDPSYNQTYNLKLFLPENTYVSTSSNNNFCYYGLNGVTCESFTIQYDNNNIDNTDNYDVSSYFGIVTNFIDGISTDMVNFGEIVQQVYDTIPSFISSFVVVLFILGNAYIVFKLIKR